MCSLVPGLWGKGLFIDFIFLIENPRSKATWLRGVPPIVNEIVGLSACVGLHQPCLASQHLRKVSKGTVQLGKKLHRAAAASLSAYFLIHHYTPDSVLIAQLWCALLTSEIHVQNSSL